MRKGEIACYKQFLLFSQCFPQLYIFSSLKCGIVWKWVNNIVRNGYQHFVLFPPCLLLDKNKRNVKSIIIHDVLEYSPAIAFSLDRAKILLSGGGLKFIDVLELLRITTQQNF